MKTRVVEREPIAEDGADLKIATYKLLTMMFGRLATEVLEFENDVGYREVVAMMKEIAAG